MTAAPQLTRSDNSACPSRSIPSDAIAESVYRERRWTAARPLGVAALEDKIVQHAVVTILNQIYEEDFLGCSYGFRRDAASMMRWMRYRTRS
jgi:retron-type reverse transcriptase